MLGSRGGDKEHMDRSRPDRSPHPLRNWEASAEQEPAGAGSCLNPDEA